MKSVLLITWDEIGGEMLVTRHTDDKLILLDRSDRSGWDKEIAKALGDDGETWPIEEIVEAKGVTLVTHRSERGHLATTQIVWEWWPTAEEG
jgi:hypothetical protein